MGGSSSKPQGTRDGWRTSWCSSTSTPASNNRVQGGSLTKMSWNVRLLSMPQTHNRGKSIKFDRVATMPKPVLEEEAKLEYENPSLQARDCVYGPGGEWLVALPGAFNSENGLLLNRCQTFHPVLREGRQCKLVTPLRKPEEGGGGDLDHVPSNLSSRDLMDQSMGLRLLLSTPSSSSRNFLWTSRAAHPRERNLFSVGSFNSRRGSEFAKRAFTRVSMDDTTPLEPQWVTAPNGLSETDGTLFDPSILATVEEAVQDTAHTTWQTAPLIASKSSSGSSEICKDAVLPELPKDNGCAFARQNSSRTRSGREENPAVNLHQLRTFSFLKRKPSFSKVLSLRNDKQNWSSEAYLDKFARMCPPGCDGKVVLYFTSLRGVRKTFEDCYMLRLILNGFRIHVDERDVWMHSKFRQELTSVMGMALSVPRLFILGRYIGGADEVELLNEEGILAKLLEGLPTECKQVCKVCADVRFIPCIACSGSRKVVSSNKDATRRCSKCNENGLIMCPMCD